MTENKFEKIVNKLCEGDYVYIELNKPFLLRQLKEKRKSYEEALGARRKSVPSTTSMPMVVPAQYSTDPPNFVVARVGEILMSLIYVVDAWEENAKTPVKKAYEYREVRNITSITADQYNLSKQKIQGN